MDHRNRDGNSCAKENDKGAGKYHGSAALRLSAVLALLFALIGTVFADWYFESPAASPVTVSIPVILGIFDYGYQNEFAPEDGSDHQTAVENIVSGPEGLNNPDSRINTLMDLAFLTGTVNSLHPLYGNILRSELNIPAGVEFLLEDRGDNEKYLYTCSVKLIGDNPDAGFYIPKGEYVYPVYRTTLQLNDETNEWEVTQSRIGAAKVIGYTSSTGIIGSERPFFDHKTWIAGKRGAGFSDAIWLDVPDSAVARTDSPSRKVYYCVKCPKNQNVTVTVIEPESVCKATVYDSNKEEISNTVAPTVNGSKTVTWQGKKGKTYYIRVEGAATISFTIG